MVISPRVFMLRGNRSPLKLVCVISDKLHQRSLLHPSMIFFCAAMLFITILGNTCRKFHVIYCIEDQIDKQTKLSLCIVNLHSFWISKSQFEKI